MEYKGSNNLSTMSGLAKDTCSKGDKFKKIKKTLKKK